MNTDYSIKNLKRFRYLSIIELIFNDDIASIKSNVVQRILNQLNENIIAVSIVINRKEINILYLWLLIKKIKKKNISVSLTINNYDVSLLKLSFLKKVVNQFRILIDESKDNIFIISESITKLKTKKNDVIFLFNIHSKANNINKYLTLLKENDYIYNISADSSLSVKEYWDLSKIINEAKNNFPMKIFQDLTCAGVIFDNLKGICPTLTSMICVGCNGEIKLCYKDTKHFDLSIFECSIELLFNKVIEKIKICKDAQCNYDYKNCFCGCPLNIETSGNKYCYYNYKEQKGGV